MLPMATPKSISIAIEWQKLTPTLWNPSRIFSMNEYVAICSFNLAFVQVSLFQVWNTHGARPVAQHQTIEGWLQTSWKAETEPLGAMLNNETLQDQRQRRHRRNVFCWPGHGRNNRRGLADMKKMFAKEKPCTDLTTALSGAAWGLDYSEL